ncbi:MAG TPA: hypothetical protein DD706_23145 [Nitrospiraceae bacterium]|nr:hypothetical protein [Nitrospiraceae bacterium]
MEFHIDIIFRSGAGYDDLVGLIQANPRYVFGIWKQDKIDKRTMKSKDRGWVVLNASSKMESSNWVSDMASVGQPLPIPQGA